MRLTNRSTQARRASFLSFFECHTPRRVNSPLDVCDSLTCKQSDCRTHRRDYNVQQQEQYRFYLSSLFMNLKPEELILIGTLAGALIGSLSTLLVTWLNKRPEERRHYRELVVNAAIEHWKHASDLA